MPNSLEIKRLTRMVRQSLSPDLLKKEWAEKQGEGSPASKGHCYAASEAMYHMLGGKEAGWVPHILSHTAWPEGLEEDETHWFLKHKESGKIVDPTADQFEGLIIPYEQSRGMGFLTKEPSHRARIIMERVKAQEASQQRAA